MSHDQLCTHDAVVTAPGWTFAGPCICAVIAEAKRDTRTRILAALRAELPTLSCYEPARLIGTPCSCVVGMARAIEIVEGLDA